MFPKNVLARVAPLGVLGLCLGCPHRPAMAPPPVRDAAELLALTDQVESQVVSLEGEATLRLELSEGKGAVTLLVSAAAPARVHLEQLDFFGRPQAVLVSDGARFGLYQAQPHRYYRGPASRQNLARFLPIPLAPAELLAILLGRAPRLSSPGSISAEPVPDAYRVSLADGVRAQTLWIDPLTHRVTHSEVRGEWPYELAFADFQGEPPAFPRKASVFDPRSRARLELRYTDVRLNGSVDPSLFQPHPPAGVPVVELDAAGNPQTP